MAQIEAFEPDWVTGEVHKEICSTLDDVIDTVAAGAKNPSKCSGGPRELFETPPGLGKTLCCGVHLIANAIGRHPDWQLIYITHSADKAADVGVDTKRRINDPRFKEIHPNLTIDKSANARDFFTTTDGGKVTFVGVEGDALGKRAHCIAAGELINTEHGLRPIEDIKAGDKVWSYNHSTGRRELKLVRATQRTPRRPIISFMANGARVRMTDEHLLFDGIRYKKARAFSIGDYVYVDRSLSSLPDPTPNPTSRPTTQVLQSQVPRRAPSKTCQTVRAMQSSYVQETRPHKVLFSRMPVEGTYAHLSPSNVPRMPHRLPKNSQPSDLLLKDMRKCGPQQARGRWRESELEGWAVSRNPLPRIQNGVVATSTCSRWGVCSVPADTTARSTSHRRGFAQRRANQSDNVVQWMPHEMARLERISYEGRAEAGISDVYDLDVADNHNFFVNGLLVHNCLIIDDPFKNEQEARSELHQEKVFKFVMSVAESRLHPYGAIVVIHQRWHPDDLIGRLKKLKARPWGIHKYPMEATEDCAWRKKGESVHKERFSQEWIRLTKQTKIEAGQEWIWQAMYQQDPVLDAGMLFQRKWFKLLPRDKFPTNLRWYISTDFATTEGRGDYSVSRPFAIDAYDNIYFDDPFHGQVNPNVAHRMTFDYYERFGAKGIFVEKGPLWNAAKGQYDKEQQARSVYPRIVAFQRVTNKGESAAGLIAHMAAGKVFHIDSEFTRNVVIPQYMAFTGERGVKEEDDIVDADMLPFLSWKEIRRPYVEADMPKLPNISPEVRTILENFEKKPVSSRYAWTAADADGDARDILHW